MTPFARSLTAIATVAAAALSVSTPASAAVDLSVKHAIVSVVLDNLGVQASDALIAEIAGAIDPADLSPELVASVSTLLDSGADPRASIEQATDTNGDGVPEAGAATKSASSSSATSDDEESDDSTTSTGSNSSGSSGSSNSGSSGGSSSPSGSGSSPGDSGDDSDDDNSGDDSDEPEDDD